MSSSGKEPLAGTGESMVFLSHAGEDTEAAKELSRVLRQNGLDVWLDIERIKPSDRWMEKLEKALHQAAAFVVYVGPSGVENWVDNEVRVALDKAAKDRSFRLIPVLGPGADPDSLPLFLKQHQWADLRRGFERAGDLAGVIKGLIGAETPGEALSIVPPGTAPFRGLLRFDVEDALLFYGREQETGELLERFRVDNFLAVVGDSGSGKSSLVRAGLIPALHRGRFHDSKAWVPSWWVAILRPGEHPFGELLKALPDLKPEMSPADGASFLKEALGLLEQGSQGLGYAISRLVPRGAHTLLIVDQFEELFTLTTEPDERSRFIDALLTAAKESGEWPVHVVITLRADFYFECWQYEELLKRIGMNQYLVRRVGSEQLREVVERPLALAGGAAEPGLVDALLDDVGDEPGNLPFLEHALLQLWERREGQTLTHKAYKDIGRLAGALKNYANEVYEGLHDEREKKIARKIFLRLTQLGEGAQNTGRPAPKVELLALGEGEAADARVLRVLSEARLITISGHVAGEADRKDEMVEVAHEALIREWPRLQRWVDEDRDSLRIERRLLQAAKDWEAAGRDPSLLLNGRLPEVQEWLKNHDKDCPPLAREYVDASVAAHKKKIRQKITRSCILTLLVVGVGAALFWGYIGRRQAQMSYHNFQLADDVVGQMLTTVDSDEIDDVPRVGEIRAELLHGASLVYKEFQVQTSNEPILRMQNALATRRLADIYRQLGQNDEAERQYGVAIDLLSDLVKQFPDNETYRQELANTHNWLGEQLRDYDHLGAKRSYDEALLLQEALVEHSPENLECKRELARTCNNRGIVLDAMDRRDDAERDFNRAIEGYESLLGAGEGDTDARKQYRQELAQSYNNLGTLLESSDGSEAALSSYTKAIERGERLVKEEPDVRQYRRELAAYYNNLGNLHFHIGQLELARHANRRALDLFEDLAAPAPLLRKELANGYNTLGVILDSLQLSAEAEVALQESIAIFERMEADDEHFWRDYELNERFANSLLGKGKLHFDRDEFGDTNRLLCRAIAYHHDLDQLEAELWYLSRSLARSRHAKFAALAEAVSSRLADQIDFVDWAKMMMHCLDLADQQNPRLSALYERRAVQLLRQGHGESLVTLEDVEAAEFEPLRKGEDFQALLKRLGT